MGVKRTSTHIFVGLITPTSSSGNRYILTVNDYFTKWAEAVALPSKHAQGVAEAHFKVIKIVGIPCFRFP